MSSATYEHLLREALVDLSEMQEVDAKAVGRKFNIPGRKEEDHQYFLQHWTSLYLRYVQIARKLADCHDQILQPQKRQDARILLDSTIGRMLEMKDRIVTHCGEYVNLDEVLVDLKLTPDAFEIPVPSYFTEERRAEFAHECDFIQKMMENHSIDAAEFEPKPAASEQPMTLERAIAIIQCNERGRQGRQHAKLMGNIKEQTAMQNKNFEYEQHMNEDDAAKSIQKIVRGFLARKRVTDMRQEELEFLGMEMGDRVASNFQRAKLTETLKTRKQRQEGNQAELAQEAKEMRAKIKVQEGGRYMEEMLDEVLLHMANLRLMAKEDVLPEFPTEEEGGSLALLAMQPGQPSPEEEAAKKAEEEAAAAAAAKKQPQKEQKKTDKELEEEAAPTIGPSMFWSRFDHVRKRYMDTWQQHFQSTYLASKEFEQRLDKDLLRQEIMDGPGGVMAELRRCVDQLVMVEVTNLRERLERERGKKPKKPKNKKPPKKKNVKDPTEGRKIEEHEGRLIVNGFLQLSRKVRLADYIGAPNMMGSIMEEYERSQAMAQDEVKKQWERLIDNWNDYVETSLRMSKEAFQELFKRYCDRAAWTFEPSMQQVRQAVTEYCVLPLGSQIVHDLAPHANTVLLYGPAKSGKTMLTHAVCTEAGAHMFNLSPAVINREGLNLGKMVQATFRVARAMAPSVVYIDEVEKVFMGGKGKKKKKGDAGAGKSGKIKKDLIAQVKKELAPTDRVIVIGNSSAPWDGEFKEVSAFFDKMICTVHPDYASRMLLWQHRCAQRGAPLEDADYEALAYMTNLYSSGTILSIIDETLTDRRVKRVRTKAVTADEFLPAMSRAKPIFKEEYEAMREFTQKLPLNLRRARYPDDFKNDDEDDKDKKKGKKKGGKK
uniref:AAA+ ATPase domain-containing protein n=1 Tax=Neobodo designis TaxID=312471 RepID=A0A7S1LCP6_NEODS|mmetsp:Transcript_18233/g.56537  ORF Transcript_18233/g.56537 Transcript_18233/m.56537 type:complete len:884 (+) Transcript_18233:199-2850(+)